MLDATTHRLSDRPRRALLTLCAFGLALALPLGAGRAADPSAVDRGIAAVEAFYTKVTDFKADFQQEVKRAHLSRPLKKSGNVYYSRPGKMRWDYTQPEKVYYISDGDVLWSYEVQTKQAIKMGVKDSDLYDSLKFLFGQGDLRGSFTITHAGDKDSLTGLKLVPKTGQQNYKSLTLWVKASGEVARTELVDPLDNVSIITFTGTTYDKLKPEGFQFKPPRGATVQDLTGPVEPKPAPGGDKAP